MKTLYIALIIIGVLLIIAAGISVAVGVFSRKAMSSNNAPVSSSGSPRTTVGSPTIAPAVAPAPAIIPAPAPVQISNQSPCDKNGCNAVMRDWIVDKYWAFDDSAKTFGECKQCDSKWFRAPFATSTNGQSWKDNNDREEAFNSVKLT
jgi:hypothetical protein